MGERISWIRVDGATAEDRRLVPLSLLLKDRAEIIQGLGVTWLNLNGAFKGPLCVHGLAAIETEDAVVVVCIGFAGIERDGFTIRLGRLRIAPQPRVQGNQVGIGTSQL